MSKQHKAFKFRIYPTPDQEIFFAKSFGCVRKVYNLMLATRNQNYRQHQHENHFRYAGIEDGFRVWHHQAKYKKLPTPAQFKKEFPFLKEVDSLALSNAQLALNKAFKLFFENPLFGYPNWKTRKNPVQSYTTNNQKGTVAVFEQKYLLLPKMKKLGLIRIKMHRHLEGAIRNVTISKTSSGKYYASILCQVDIQLLKKTNKTIGIDLGIEAFATLSDGTKINNPRFSKNLAARLRREQRKLSKKALLAKNNNRPLWECKNYQKQRIIVAKINEKIANQRRDFLNKLSTDLIKNHDVICLESLNIKGMVKNRKLAKSIQDVSWSSFIERLVYKADWYGKDIQTIDQWFPSSQLCSACQTNTGKKTLNIRNWICPNCHQWHDRDVNAAKNILKEGLRRFELEHEIAI